MKLHFAKLGCATVVGLVLFAGQVYAQQSPAKAQSGTVALEDIVVTATKRTGDLQRTPAAITAVTGERLAELGIRNMEGLGALIPSARFAPIGASTHLFIRGIGTEQDRVFVDQLVAMVVDGVYIPREAAIITQLDVHQIEVLPGPQGTLYGPGAVGGVINIANNRPTWDMILSASLEVGNYAGVHGTLVQNMPISDTVALRGALDYEKHHPYQTGDADSRKAFSGRLSLLVKPSDDFSAYLWGSIYRDTGAPANGVVVTASGPKFANPHNPWDSLACSDSPCSFIPKTNIGPNRGDLSVSMLAGQLDWTIGNATLSFIPTNLESSSETLAYAGPIFQKVETAHHQYSAELRLSSNLSDNLKLISGIYWLKTHDFQDFALNGPSGIIVHNRQENYSGFGQMTYSFQNNLRLTGGIRLSSLKKEDDYVVPSLNPAGRTWTRFDWKAGLEADVAPGSMLYGAVQTGFADGTFDSTNPKGDQPGFVASTTLLSYTAGFKTRFFDRRLEFNSEFFYYDYNNYLLSTVIVKNDGTNSNGLFTIPKYVVYGNQIDMRALISDNLQLNAAIGYVHARTKNFVSGGISHRDSELFETPEWTASLSAQYRWDLKSGATVTALVSSHYENGYWVDFPHGEGARQRSFTKSDLSLIYRAADDRWTVGLWARNLENKAQLGPAARIGAGVTQALAFISPPRTYGIRMSVNMRPN